MVRRFPHRSTSLHLKSFHCLHRRRRPRRRMILQSCLHSNHCYYHHCCLRSLHLLQDIIHSGESLREFCILILIAWFARGGVDEHDVVRSVGQAASADPMCRGAIAVICMSKSASNDDRRQRPNGRPLRSPDLAPSQIRNRIDIVAINLFAEAQETFDKAQPLHTSPICRI